VTRWAVVTSGGSEVWAEEHDHAERLTRS
jgi:hypothetical protein